MDPSITQECQPPLLQSEAASVTIGIEGLDKLNKKDMPPCLDKPRESVHRTSPVNEAVFQGPVAFFGGGSDTPSFKDVPDCNAIPGVCGLRNLGNTCFMNAGLQCLMCNTKLVKHFLENLPEEIIDGETLTSKFYCILEKAWCGQFSVLWPSKFKDILGMYFSQFEDYRQHDCQEFLALILDALHEQLNEANSLEKYPMSAGVVSQAKCNNEQCRSEQNNEGLLNNKNKRWGSSSNINNLHDLAGPNNLSLSKVQELVTSEMAHDSSREVTPSSEFDTAGNVTPMSEESNHSTSSFQSADSIAENNSHRMHAIPSCVKAGENSEHVFKPIDLPNKLHVASTSVDGSSGGSGSDSKNETEDVAESEDGETNKPTHIPSIQDLYMKDTKTKNVNVVAAEAEDIPTYDSEKFTKHDNGNNAQYEAFNSLNEVADFVAKPGPSKSIKSTNLFSNLPNNREKFGGECLKMKFNSMEVDDNICSINNIKRMKVDDTPKNVKQEAKRKVNVAKNITKEKLVNANEGAGEQCMASGDSFQTNQLPCDPQSRGNLERRQNDPVTAADVAAAEKAWQQYVSRNCSVIVDTFQGQFKNTIVCSECRHVSVTFEPFMYLSVPLPHAMERQIPVIYVTCDNRKTVRYLLTLHKQDSVLKLKKELKALVENESADIALAEVFQHHISRILEDHVLLRLVNDQNRTIYAFEMGPLPCIDEPTSDKQLDASSFNFNQGNNQTSNREEPADVFCTIGMFDAGMVCNATDLTNSYAPAESKRYNSPVWGDYVEEWPAADSIEKSQDWTNPEGEWSQEAVMDQSDSSVTTLEQDDYDIPCSQNYTNSWLAGLNKTGCAGSDIRNAPITLTLGGSSAGRDDGKLADVWKMCAICLEDIPSADLLTHSDCGGTLCNSCFEMSLKHYGSTNFTCPVCSNSVDPTEGFVPLSSVPEFKPKPRVLSVPVIFHHDSQQDKPLFGHPRLLYFSSHTKGENIYEEIDKVIPVKETYSITLTDGQGLRCSRCLYTDHCSGCEVPRHGDVNLITGDHLSVKFGSLQLESVDEVGQSENHTTMEKLRSNEPLTLFDCLQAFSESEILDEHNPWFCPKCSKNQCAKKTLTVWSFPDTMVIYLKRFVYHELSSTKVDNKVVFPIENLDVSNYLSGPDSLETQYDLQAAVCHFGSTNAGHYTAYGKHPMRDEWFYYNDETTTQQTPGDDVFNNAYILFYQRQGNQPQFRLPEKPKEGDSCKAQRLSGPAMGNSIGSINPETFSQLLQDLADTSTKEEKDSDHHLDFYG